MVATARAAADSKTGRARRRGAAPAIAVAVAVGIGVPAGRAPQAWADSSHKKKDKETPEQIAAKTEAMRLYQQGDVHFNLGEYDLAIVQFKEAYRVFPAPGFLYNLGQAYRLKGDCANAQTMYRNYLRLEPKTPNRATIEKQLDEMTLCVENLARDAVAASGPEPAPPRPRPSAVPDTTRAGARAAAPQAEGHADGGEAGSRDHGRRKRLTGLAVGGGGLLLAGAGAWFAADASSAADEVSAFYAHGGKWEAVADADARGRRSRLFSISLLTAGGAAIVGGAVLYYLGHRERDLSLALDLRPGGGDVAVSWQF